MLVPLQDDDTRTPGFTHTTDDVGGRSLVGKDVEIESVDVSLKKIVQTFSTPSFGVTVLSGDVRRRRMTLVR